MGFNKRYYDTKSIVSKAKSLDFKDFDRYMTISDAHIYEDTFARKIHMLYLESDEETRRQVFESLQKHKEEH